MPDKSGNYSINLHVNVECSTADSLRQVQKQIGKLFA